MKKLERIHLAQLPTPIQYLKELSQELGKNIYVKRDDFTGMEVSGNKIRKLEYSLAEAFQKGCDTVITVGALQSNHCRATAFACAKLGLNCHVVMQSERPKLDSIEGNTFMDLMANALVHFIGEDIDRNEFIKKLWDELEAEGKSPYFIPVGASNAVGSCGYLQCFEEIKTQEKELGVEFDAIVLAVGSGGTYAGLWFANEVSKSLGVSVSQGVFEGQEVAERQHVSASQKDIVGICVAHNKEIFTKAINEIVHNLNLEMGRPLPELAALPEPLMLPAPPVLPEKEYIFHLVEGYVGEGYAKTSKPEIRFLIEITRKTGIVFDPCYTGKAFRGMVNEIKNGELSKKENILFIHTGGLFGWTESSRAMAVEMMKGQMK